MASGLYHIVHYSAFVIDVTPLYSVYRPII